VKSLFCAVVVVAVCALPCQAAFITQSQLLNLRFLDARTGNQAEPEPLRFGAESADKIALLDIGQYTSADAGKTFTFMRDAANNAQWDAIRLAMQGPLPFSNTTGLPTMWLGSDELEEDEGNTSNSLVRSRLSAGFPTYNLQRVDITVRYYRTGTDDGATFRTAAFDATWYWLVPEPATWLLMIGTASFVPFRRRLKPQIE
jgi:hypothetical protein